MKLPFSAIVLLVLCAAGSAAAQAQAGNTREQVLRELAEARRVGDIMAPGCGGGTLREAFPQRYPARQSVAESNPKKATEPAPAQRRPD
jgi:hypothetical protein